MIKNQLEYQVTQEWVNKFKQSIEVMDREKEKNDRDLQKWQLNRDALQCQIEQLQREISEYERLKNCHHTQPIRISIESLTKLPDILIKARIAANLSQEELAEQLQIEPKCIYDYEENNYQSASFLEILEVATVLGVSLETAVVRVDFDEIKTVQLSAQC